MDVDVEQVQRIIIKFLFQVQKLIVVCWQCSRVRLYRIQECLSGVLVFVADQSAMMMVLARHILRY